MSFRSRSLRLTVGLLFLLPNLLGVIAFIVVPLVMSFGMAFTDWDFLRHNLFRHETLHFVGVGNFARLFAHPLFWQYLGNTFFLMLGLPFSIAGSLGAALLLTRAGRARHRIKPALILAVVILTGSGLMLLRGGMAESGVWFFFGLLAATTLIAGVLSGGMLYRTLLYLPNFTAGVATFVLWKKLYNPAAGPINQVLTPLLDQFSAWVRDMPGAFAYGLPIMCAGLAVVVAGWQIRRLRRTWDNSDAGAAAIITGIFALVLPLVLLMTWWDTRFPVAVAESVGVGAVLAGFIFRRKRAWGRTKSSDKGLGTEIALAMVVIPVLLLLAAGLVLGPSLPAAAAAGIDPPNWLGSYYWSKPALIMMMLWAAIGSNNMILYLAGLSNISPELYEAADMDGATAAQRFWFITWPQLAPVTFFISIMSIIYGLQGGFEMARAMTTGGPAGSTTTLSYFIFNEGFETGRIGYASAIAWVLFALVFALSLCNFRYGNRNAEE